MLDNNFSHFVCPNKVVFFHKRTWNTMWTRGLSHVHTGVFIVLKNSIFLKCLEQKMSTKWLQQRTMTADVNQIYAMRNKYGKRNVGCFIALLAMDTRKQHWTNQNNIKPLQWFKKFAVKVPSCERSLYVWLISFRNGIDLFHQVLRTPDIVPFERKLWCF